jgi:hypothetical protein
MTSMVLRGWLGNLEEADAACRLLAEVRRLSFRLVRGACGESANGCDAPPERRLVLGGPTCTVILRTEKRKVGGAGWKREFTVSTVRRQLPTAVSTATEVRDQCHARGWAPGVAWANCSDGRAR